MKRKCSKCKESHEPPRGLKCQREETVDTPSVPVDYQSMMETIQQLGQTVQTLADKVDNMQNQPVTQQTTLDVTTETTHTGTQLPQPGSSMVTLSGLQQDLNLQAKVSQRLQALVGLDSEDSDDEGNPTPSKRLYLGKKSGRARTADDRVLTHVDWPHFHVYRAGSDKSPKYSELTLPEFVSGFCSQLLQGNGDNMRLMVNHLRELMEDAEDFSWDKVRNYHGILLNYMERKRITWDDTENIQILRRRHAQIPNTQQLSKRNTSPGQATKKTVCIPYQTGKCTEKRDHQGEKGFVRHACNFCFTKFGQLRKHKESECKTKQSKN